MLATVLQIISMNLLIIEYCIKIVYSKTLIIGSTLTIFTFLKYVNKKITLQVTIHTVQISKSKLKKNQDEDCIIHVLLSQHETCIFDLEKSE